MPCVRGSGNVRQYMDYYIKKKKVDKIKIVKEILNWCVSIIVVVTLAFLLVYLGGEQTSTIGQSMEPTLENGDTVFINKLNYFFSDPKRFDIVVFRPKGNENHYYMKRVIGLPGEEVQIIDGEIYIDGEILKEPVNTDLILNPGIASEPVTLGSDEYFLLGDNRNNSEDSRFANIGNIEKDNIIGKVWLRIKPFDKFGRIK
jgi:signal peptidase I